MENFSIDELENILNLKKNYKKKDIENNCNILTNKIILSIDIDDEDKIDKLNFIRNAQTVLINYLSKVRNNNISFNLIDNIENNEDVIKAPYLNKNPVNAFVDTYSTGKINPIKRELIETTITIDSYYRNNQNYTFSNDFLIFFNQPLKNVISYEINSIEIPNMWYLISSIKRNNEFTITVENYNDGSGNFLTTTHIIRIPDGNYSVNEITEIMNNYFNNRGEGLDFLIFGINTINAKTIIRAKHDVDLEYADLPKPFEGDASTNIYYSPDFRIILNFDLEEDQTLREQKNNLIQTKNQCTYFDPKTDLHKICDKLEQCDCSPEDIRIINMNIRDYRLNLGYFLGFTETKYIVDGSNTFNDNFFQDTSNVVFQCYISAENNYGDSVDKYVLLHIDDFNKNKKINFTIANNEQLSENIIAKIPVSSPSYTVINQTSGDRIFRKCDFFGPVDIYKLRVKLLDKVGNLIDLRRNNFSFSLLVKQIYS